MVINIRDIRSTPWPDGCVYIGRSGKGLKGPFGNPISIGQKCPHCGQVHDRGGTLVCYRIMLEHRLKTDPTFRQAVKELAGKTLVCFCKPLPCHGDILAEYAERLSKEGA